MKVADLNTKERIALNYIAHFPSKKYTQSWGNLANTLASYGLLRYAGNMQYELTKEGSEIIVEIERN